MPATTERTIIADLEELVDKNSRGLGVALRAAGALLPLAAWWALFLNVDRPGSGSSSAPRAVSSVFAVIAYSWAWPDSVYREAPLAFGTLGPVEV